MAAAETIQDTNSIDIDVEVQVNHIQFTSVKI